MEVWRIRKNESGSFVYGLYGSKEDAKKYLPKLIGDEFSKHRWPSSDKYTDISLSVIKETGKYINKKYGLDWEVVCGSYETSDSDENSSGAFELDYDWHDISEMGFLHDEEYYDVQLLDGSSFNSALFIEDEGVFRLDDSDIQLDEVESFRLCY